MIVYFNQRFEHGKRDYHPGWAIVSDEVAAAAQKAGAVDEQPGAPPPADYLAEWEQQQAEAEARAERSAARKAATATKTEG